MRVVRCQSCSSSYCGAWSYGSPAVKTNTSQSCWCPACPGVLAHCGPACALPCTSAPLSACHKLVKEKERLEADHCIWFCRLAGLVCRQLRHVEEPAVGWHWWGEACVTPRTPLLTARARSLRQEENLSGRRSRNNTATGTTCATGLLFLLLAKVKCDSGTLISLSVCFGCQMCPWRDSTWAVWPATSCWGSSQVSHTAVVQVALQGHSSPKRASGVAVICLS